MPLYLTVVVSLSECMLVCHAYGERRLLNELPAADHRWARWWALCWRYLIPTLLTVLLLSNVYAEYVSNPFGAGASVSYPAWALAIGSCLALGPMLLGPLCYVDAVRDVCTRRCPGMRDGLRNAPQQGRRSGAPPAEVSVAARLESAAEPGPLERAGSVELADRRGLA